MVILMNQKSKEKRMKYYENELSMPFHNYCIRSNGKMYNADGSYSDGNVSMTTNYEKNHRTEQVLFDDNGTYDSLDNTEILFDDEINKFQSNRKSRYIEHSYIPNGKKGKVAKLDRLSEIKIGKATRSTQETIRDSNIDEYNFHFTYKKFNEINPSLIDFPIDSRIENRKFIE